jgi:hypothetical protein
LFIFERFIYNLRNSVNLLHSGVFLAKFKLVFEVTNKSKRKYERSKTFLITNESIYGTL